MGIEGAHIGHLQLVGQQFRELIDARQQGGGLFDQFWVASVLGHFGVMIPDHRDAGRRRNADYGGVAEDLYESFHHGKRFPGIAGIVVHLAATGLGGRKLDAMPEPFEYGNDGFAAFGEKRIVVARDK